MPGEDGVKGEGAEDEGEEDDGGGDGDNQRSERVARLVVVGRLASATPEQVRRPFFSSKVRTSWPSSLFW
jgi:hypothetical protein